MASIALAWFYVEDLSRLSEFCAVLTGSNLPKGLSDRAAITLRDMLLKVGVVGDSRRIDAFKKTQKAIVSFIDYKEITKLFASNTFFDWPLRDCVRS
jgi:hypothetical protein